MAEYSRGETRFLPKTGFLKLRTGTLVLYSGQAAETWASLDGGGPGVGQRQRTRDQQEAEFEADLEWLVEETVRLRFDLARLVLALPRLLIRLARGEQENAASSDAGSPQKTEEPKGH